MAHVLTWEPRCPGSSGHTGRLPSALKTFSERRSKSSREKSLILCLGQEKHGMDVEHLTWPQNGEILTRRYRFVEQAQDTNPGHSQWPELEKLEQEK